jgi:hypothetical protein
MNNHYLMKDFFALAFNLMKLYLHFLTSIFYNCFLQLFFYNCFFYSVAIKLNDASRFTAEHFDVADFFESNSFS